MNLTETYLADVCEHGPTASQIVDAVVPSVVATMYQGRALSRPVFLERALLDQVAGDVAHVFDAITDLPRRLFGGDLAGYARAVGMSEEQARVVTRFGGAAPTRLCRADLYRVGAGFELMEINTGSALGGLDNTTLNEAMLKVPFIGDFVATHGLGYVDTMRALVETIVAEVAHAEGARPFVAIADFPDSYPELEAQLFKSAAALSEYGIDATPCPADRLVYRDDGLWLDERRVDVVYRLFLIEDLLKPGAAELLEPILLAAERGQVSIFTSLGSELYGSKANLAMLSDELNRGLFSAAELASIARIVPWTRMVRDGRALVDGREQGLLAYAVEHREDLVLKPTSLHGGQGVVLGWEVPAQVWQDRLRAALGGAFVLQRRICPELEQFPIDANTDTDTDAVTEAWLLNWSVFLTASGFGGIWIRGSRGLDGGVVNIATGATGTCCFHEL